MRDAAPQTIFLKDYCVPAYLVDHVALHFDLHPTATRVHARIQFRPNPDTKDRAFFLHGEHLKLISAKIDGASVTPNLNDEGLTCAVPDAPFIWETVVEIAPENNTALSGLYMSNGMYCTQCEAEGFRRITYYPDRPDVMATFDVTINSELPILLSNGNPRGQKDGHATWSDPWPKPAYLFALVAGDLLAHSDQFTTMSGKVVDLNIYVRDGDLDKCDFAMSALKASMDWDERVYGREYDLDIFNIVAVDDFNMGAMENKGLNIFNSSAVLCNSATSTDANFERIEAIIAHEYFHNWTGNRITCRDWFQLSLKEGLTVYRDQQFSADVRGKDVRRIDDVIALRGRQFREDNGPLAHPVRPESFVEINNFYTATIYEKGAELIRMMHLLVGDTGYKKALDLYFERHDGQACTIEDWLQIFEDTSGRDLTQFKLWYRQAGTPRVTVEEEFDDGCYRLTFEQTIPESPGQTDKHPMVIPIALGLLDANGVEVQPTTVVELTDARRTFRFDGLESKPIPSLLRGFSAPVILKRKTPRLENLVRLRHDTDMFNRWEAGRNLGRETLVAMTRDDIAPSQDYLETLVAVAHDSKLDPAFRALCLALPSQDDVAQSLVDLGETPDPIQIDDAHRALASAIAQTGEQVFAEVYNTNQVHRPYSPDAASCGHRALAGAALGFITYLDGGAQALAQYDNADNMTQQMAALAQVIKSGHNTAAVVDDFYAQWQHERLVVDKWFSAQVLHCSADQGAAVAKTLSEHPDFTLKNPNRFRALVGALAMRPAAFHQPDGASYGFVSDQLIALDDLNPQTAARMTTVFETWPRYDANRQAMMRAALQKISTKTNLSRDVGEMVQRLLNA